MDVGPRQFQFDSVDRHPPTVRPDAMSWGGSHAAISRQCGTYDSPK
jgi:hypothetical protein